MEMQQAIVPGATVYDLNADKVGTVVSTDGAYVVVEKGFFFPKDYYIPVDVIADTDQSGIYLSITKNDALDQGWDQQPVDTTVTDNPDDYADAYTGTTAARTEQDTLRVPVHEEHLAASKRVADAGEVTIDKRIVTEQETIEVPVTEERVRVQWTAPTGEVTDEGEVFEEGIIEVPVSREVVDVSKRTVQTGELEVTKEREQRTQKVTDSVRREVVDVDGATVEGEPGNR